MQEEKRVKPLTEKQKRVLDFINSFVREKGYSPSLKEIGKFLNKKLSTAQYFVDELETKGYLKKNTHKTRGIMPLSKPQVIPLLGYVSAGEPLEPIEVPEEITVPENIKIDTRYPHYALQVRGNSMMDMGILNGDIVLVKHQLTAESGDIVVAVTEKGATLKVFKKKGNSITLEPRNKTFPTIVPEEIEIRGKYIGLIRSVSNLQS